MSKLNYYNSLINEYMIHSYLYYELDKSIIPDSEFDDLCSQILQHWEKIEHEHKYLVSKETLAGGSGYDLKYPQRVIGAAEERLIAEGIYDRQGRQLRRC